MGWSGVRVLAGMVGFLDTLSSDGGLRRMMKATARTLTGGARFGAIDPDTLLGAVSLGLRARHAAPQMPGGLCSAVSACSPRGTPGTRSIYVASPKTPAIPPTTSADRSLVHRGNFRHPSPEPLPPSQTGSTRRLLSTFTNEISVVSVLSR